MQVYPNDLLKELKAVWSKAKKYSGEKIKRLPSDNIVLELLETVYHASFLTEESRKIGVRILFAQVDEIAKEFESPHAVDSKTLIKFEQHRVFSKGEILRLAPATDLEKMLIGVELDKKKNLKIWGLIDIGSSWWKYIHGEASSGTAPPNHLTISSTNPGNISISRSGTIILNLNGGKITRPLSGIFYGGPIYDFCQSGHVDFYKEICGVLNVRKFDKYDDHYPTIKYIEFIERLIFSVRNLHHGGTLIVVPDKIASADVRLKDRLNIKYPLDFNKTWDALKKSLVTWKNYHDNFFKLRDRKNLISPKDFGENTMLEHKVRNLQEYVDDIIKFISSLSGIDGAVVITDKYRLLGFGCEVIVNSPSLTHVSVAEDIQGSKLYEIPIESYGTRHRSAFRFCSSFEDSMAIIISQDGGVKAVKRVGQKVILWPDINEGHYGI